MQQVVGVTMAREAWQKLAATYAFRSQAHVRQIINQLYYLQQKK